MCLGFIWGLRVYLGFRVAQVHESIYRGIGLLGFSGFRHWGRECSCSKGRMIV